MRYLSLFSGIEAATSAWHRLGWECVGVCEVEPYCVRLLAHHYPSVPNLGDVTKITEEQIAALGPLDVLIFGSPCQDLSVAGKRKGFTHDNGDTTRSGLFFTAMQIIGWARKHNNLRFALWENVPGAFSSGKGRDFAAVVDILAGMERTEVPAKGWGTEGCAVGSEAMVEWAVLDAQWFGVAQRRRRVFALADFGDWASRPPILLEPESMRGDSAPSREAGQEVAGTLAIRLGGGGFPGSDESCSGYVQPVGSALIPEVSHCLNAGGMGRCDYESETMIPVASMLAFNSNAQVDQMKFDPELSAPLTCSQYSAVAIAGTLEASAGRSRGAGTPIGMLTVALSHVETMPTLRAGSPSVGPGPGARSGDCKDEYIVPVCVTGDRTHALKAEGFDASEDGTGRGQPIVAYRTAGDGAVYEEGDRTAPLTTGTDPNSNVIAYGVALNIYGGNKRKDRPEGGFYVREEPTTKTLDASSGLNPTCSQGGTAVLSDMQVRRLTPRECERLQGFPDDHTLIPVKGKPAADGPRYKALGNSMAVPVIVHIGEKIEIASLFS